jgi:hypothetical protein
VRGYLFNAAAESISLQGRVPSNYSATADCTLELRVLLNAAETTGDDILAHVSLVTKSDGEDVTGTSTLAYKAHDIGADSAAGILHIVEVTLDFDDSDNPIAADDSLYMEATFGTTEVAGVILVEAYLKVPVNGPVQ